MGRIGLLGGTFDPPHWGHLWLAETARSQLDLAQVIFLPAGEPPHKRERQITAVSHRVAMLQQALAGNEAFRTNRTDADRPPPHTTVTLLPLLQQQFPAASLWWLIGSDSLRDLPTWVQPQQIIRQCRFAVLPRPGVTIDEKTLETAVPGVLTAVDWLQGPLLHLSSTDVRHWTAAGHSLRYLLPTAVADYITQHQLYRPHR